MDYSTLIAAKTTAGSIKRFCNYAELDSEEILEEAQALLYSTLRVREMRASVSLAVSEDDASVELPTGYLDPIGTWFRDTDNLRYKQLTESALLNLQVYEDDALVQGVPTYWTILNENFIFDCKFSEDKTLLPIYYKRPTLLSASNETNWLTDRYPHLLRQACKVQAHAFMKSWTAYNTELPLLTAAIDRANVEADLTYRGANYDQE